MNSTIDLEPSEMDLLKAGMIDVVETAVMAASPGGGVLYSNLAFSRMVQMAPEQVAASHWHRFFAPTDWEALERLLGEAETLRHPISVSLLLADGSSLPVQVCVRDLKVHQTEASCFFVSEVAARQAQERRAEVSPELSPLSATGAGTWSWDPRSGKWEWSPQLFSLFGLDPRKVAPSFETWRNALHPDDRPFVATRIEQAAHEHSLLNIEFRIVLPDGKVRWITALGQAAYDAPGQPIHMAGICLDVTRHKHLQSLQSGEHRLLKMVADRSPLESILANLSRFIEAHSPGTVCSVLLLDSDGIHLRHGAAPSLPEAYVRAIDDSPIGPRAGSCGTSAFRKEPVFVSDISMDPLWADYRALAAQHGLRACWSIPIISHEQKVLGTFAIYYREPRSPGPTELHLIEVAVQLAKIALEHQLAEESDQRFRIAFASAAVGMALKSVTGQFQAVNPALCAMLGYTEQELLGLDYTAITFPEDLPASRELVRQLLAREISSSIDHKRYVTKSGGLVWAQTSLALLTDSQGRPANLVAIIEDISERKRAEQVLRQSEQQLRLFIKSAPVAIAMFDHQMRYLAASARWLEYHGLSQEVLGKCHYVTSPQIPARWKQVHQRGLAGAIERSEEDAFLRPDGSIAWIKWEVRPWYASAGRVGGIVIFVEDITGRRQAEENLRESEARFRDLANAVPQTVWIARPDTGDFIYANRKWFEVSGLSEAQTYAPGGWQQVVHPDDLGRVLRTMSTSLETGQPFELEIREKGKDGGYRWYLNRAVPARDDSGKILRWVGSSTDIENQKNAEQFLERCVAQRTAKLHEAISELEQFSYSITHDLRAPLRAIQGFATLLETRAADQLSPANLEYLRHINASSQRMDTLIRDSLNYGKLLLSEITLLPIDLAALTHSIIQSYPALQPPRAEITLLGDFPLVLANESALAQCVSNLLNNAVKFVAPGTLPRVRVHAEPRDEWVRLWIEDNGIGIAPEFHERIFEMYQQLDKNFEGTGIGLAIVRKAVERMGGRVGVKSSPGQGSRFWLDLKRPVIPGAP